MKQNLIVLTIVFSLITIFTGCGAGGDSKPIMTKKTDDNLTVTLSGSSDKLKNGKQELMLAFTDAAGKPADITKASLNFQMPAMGSMSEMNGPAALTTTATAGQFKGTVDIEMAGEWIAQITYEGTSGNGKVSFPVTAGN